MLRADRRFVVSHVGSMVRPPAMIPYLQKALYVEHDDDNLYMLKTRLERCGDITDSEEAGRSSEDQPARLAEHDPESKARLTALREGVAIHT
jgi:hypothetical protein